MKAMLLRLRACKSILKGGVTYRKIVAIRSDRPRALRHDNLAQMLRGGLALCAVHSSWSRK